MSDPTLPLDSSKPKKTATPVEDADPITTSDDGNDDDPIDHGKVDPKDHQRALDDLTKLKKANKDLQDKMKAKERDELVKTKNYEQIAELEREEKESYKTRYERLQASFLNDKRYETLKVEALKAGLKSEALADLGLLELENKMPIETSSMGRVVVHGVKQMVDELKTTRPHWFGSKSAKVNGRVPDDKTLRTDQNPDDVTIDDIMAAEAVYRKSKLPADFKKYEALHSKYRAKGAKK